MQCELLRRASSLSALSDCSISGRERNAALTILQLQVQPARAGSAIGRLIGR